MPYCGMDIGDKTLGCTLDRGSVAACSLATLDEGVPADFRVSETPHKIYLYNVHNYCSIFQTMWVGLWKLLITAHISGESRDNREGLATVPTP
jgi:hypothetical protein